MTLPPDPVPFADGAVPCHPPKRELFAHEYLKDLNAKQAVIRAGYAETNASQQAWHLLQDPHVQARVTHLVGRLMEKHDILADRILAELAYLAYSDLTDVCQWGPDGIRVVPSEKLPPLARAAVKKIDIRQTQEQVTKVDGTVTTTTHVDVRVEMHDKLRALALLGEYRKLWGQGSDYLPDETEFRPVALLPPAVPQLPAQRAPEFEH